MTENARSTIKTVVRGLSARLTLVYLSALCYSGWAPQPREAGDLRTLSVLLAKRQAQCSSGTYHESWGDSSPRTTEASESTRGQRESTSTGEAAAFFLSQLPICFRLTLDAFLETVSVFRLLLSGLDW